MYSLLCLPILALITTSLAFEGTMYVNEGEKFTVPCKNDTPGYYFGVIWKEKDEIYALLPTTGLKIHRRIFKRSRLVNDTSLQIDNANLDDAGVYECNLIYYPKEINFPHVVVPSLVKVVIFARPTITSLSPAIQDRSIGEKAVIECEFSGIPFANVSWKFDGGKDVKYKYTTINNTSVLKLRRLRRKDTGYYTCIAYNRAGKIEKRAYIKVMYPPKVTYITPNPHIDLEKTGTITCRAKGYPLPTMYWYLQKRDSEMTLSSGYRHFDKYFVSVTKTDKEEEWSQSELTINFMQVGDLKYNYSCVAVNNEGSMDKLFRVVGFAKPEPPALKVSKITADSALLHWSIPFDGGSKLIAFVVQYKITFKKEWKSREIRPANLQDFHLMGLIPNTQYAFRVSARNRVGLSAFSSAIRIYTNKEEPDKDSGGTVGPFTKGTIRQIEKKGILGDLSLTAIIGIVGGVFLFLLVIFAITFCLLRNARKSANFQQGSVFGSSRPVSIENGSLMLSEGRRPSRMPSDTSEFLPLMPRADHWEFPRGRLRLSTVLGSGAFGMVMRGDAEGIRGSSGSVKVAVKIAKDDDNEFARKDLHAELDVLKLLPEHPNVLSLLGCCTRNEPLMIIVEYCAHGDLQGFLRSSRGITESYYKSMYHPIGQKMTSKMLLTFAFQIAKGMSHLAAYKIIHRDLAARNILVDEDLVCKISDFGFARDIYVEDQYMKKSKGGRFPIKWMALESLLDGISTSKSDVWSFGVVLWEIITLGASPYPGLNSYELVSFLQDGYRMDKPKHCSDELYGLCMQCWHVGPQRRPTFTDLSDILTGMLNDTKEYINMNFYQNHLYENFDVNLGCQTSMNGGSLELPASETTPLTIVLEDTASATSS